MRESRRLGGERFVFAGGEGGLVDLARRVPEVLASLGERAQRLAQALALAVRLAHRRKCLAVRRARGVEPRQPIECEDRGVLAQQALVLVLAVQVEQQLAEALEARERDRRLVHTRAAAAFGGHFAADDQLVAVERPPPFL